MVPPNVDRRSIRRRASIGGGALLVIAIVAGIAGLVTAGVGRPSAVVVIASAGPATSGGHVTGTARPDTPPPGPVSPAPTTTPGNVRPSTLGDRGYLTDLAELKQRAALAATGAEPEASALTDLMAWAGSAVASRPKPAEPLRITGTTGRFVDDSATAYGLALAWGASGDRRFAESARTFILAWVAKTRTLQGACPDRGDCQTSLIVSRAAPDLVFAIDLLSASGVVSASDLAAFRDWLRTVILPAASTRPNNWGDAGVFLRVVATDFLGDQGGFAAAIDAWRTHLDLVARDGHIPEEVRRKSAGLSYTQEALLYKLAVARIAERRGIDLWNVQGARGGTLRSAVDLAARYFAHPKRWPWYAGVTVPDPSPGWELAFAHWRDPAYVSLVAAGRPFGSMGHSAIRWTTLTNGIPFGG